LAQVQWKEYRRRRILNSSWNYFLLLSCRINQPRSLLDSKH
jgi:hypothetical protein